MSLLAPICAAKFDASGHVVVEEVPWYLVRGFPVNAESIPGFDWLQTLAKYRFSESDISDPDLVITFRAPASGRVQLARHRGQVVMVYQPLHPGDWAFSAGGWFSPHGNALVVHSPELQDTRHQRRLAAFLVSQNMRDYDRGLSIEETSGTFTLGELVSLADAQDVWDALDRDDLLEAIRIADRVAELLAPALVEGWIDGSRGAFHIRQGGLLPISEMMSLGWAHIPLDDDGLTLPSDPWFWFDVDAVLRRLDEVGTVSPPFQWGTTRHDERIRVWFERDDLRLSRITLLECEDLDLFTPPPDRPIPPDVLRLRPGAAINAHTRSSTARWHAVGPVDPDHLPPESSLGDVVGVGQITTIDLDSPPDGADPVSPADLEPYHVVLIALTGTDREAAVLSAFPSIMAAAAHAAQAVQDVVAEMDRFLAGTHSAAEYTGAGKFHEPVSNQLALQVDQLQSTIVARIVHAATQTSSPDAASDLRALATSLRDRVSEGSAPRAAAVRRDYAAINARALAAAQRLNLLFTVRLSEELVSSTTAWSIGIYNEVLDAMAATQEGLCVLQQRLSGFVDQRVAPEFPPPFDPVMTASTWRRLWKVHSTLRAPLAATMVKAARVDVYVRTINQLIARPTAGGASLSVRAWLVTELTDLFEREFGVGLGVEVQRRRISLPSGAEAIVPEFTQGDAPRAAADLARAAGPARGLANALNTLNVIGQLLIAGLASAEYAREPTSAHLLSLSQSAQGVLVGGLTMAEQAALMRRGTAGQVLPTLSRLSTATGLVLGGIGLADAIAAERRIAVLNDDDQLFWHRVWLAAWASSTALETAALVGLSLGPLGMVATFTLAVVSLGAAAATVATAARSVELDFSHSLFGNDYPTISQDGAPSGEADPPGPLDRTDTNNVRGDFYRSLPTQIAQLKGVLSPLEATFSRTPDDEHILRVRPLATAEGAIVLFQLWHAGDPLNERLTDFFQLRTGSYGIATGSFLGGTFHVVAQEPGGSRDRWEIAISFDATRPGSWVSGLNFAAVSVAMQPPVGVIAAAVADSDELAVRQEFLQHYDFAARALVELADA